MPNKTISLLAEALSAAVRGDLAEVAKLARRIIDHTQPEQPTLPGVPAPEPEPPSKVDERRAAVMRLFVHWQVACDHRTAKPTTERLTCIMARLKEGYSEAEVRKGIDGASAHAHVNETTGVRYDDLTLICRNGSRLENFIQRGVAATGAMEFTAGDVGQAGMSLEDEISAQRRKMAELLNRGEEVVYQAENKVLRALLARRKGK